MSPEALAATVYAIVAVVAWPFAARWISDPDPDPRDLDADLMAALLLVMLWPLIAATYPPFAMARKIAYPTRTPSNTTPSEGP
jgi:hypothetical protein